MILDGQKTADFITKRSAEEVELIEEPITLALILVGHNPASEVYVNMKKKACDAVGINVKDYLLEETATQKDLLKIIKESNGDKSVHAILVQLPLPSHIDEATIINAIAPEKDVDGLTLINQGKLFIGEDTIEPATPRGVISLLKKNYIDIAGKNVVVVGRSRLVGKPLAILFEQNNATVTIAHSRTANLKEVTKRADILVAAIGKPNFITGDMIKKDAVVIDVGTTKVDGKLTGDVKFDEVFEIASFITPVPKGVGPMTIASLLENIVLCYRKQKRIEELNN